MKRISSLVLIISMALTSVLPAYAQEQLTPQERVIRQQLIDEYGYENESEADLMKAVKVLASQQPDDYYHEQDIINHLRDKLIMMENDGHFIPSKEVQSILPTDGPVNDVSTDAQAMSEILRFSTKPIAGYDDKKLGIEVLRKVDLESEPAKIVIGIRVFASDKFQRAIESTSVVLNSNMEPAGARLKMDQAINTLARLVGNKISFRMNPKQTENLVLALGGFGSIAFTTTFVWVIKKLFFRKSKSSRLLVIAMLISWAASIVSSIYLEESGDYNYLEEEMD